MSPRREQDLLSEITNFDSVPEVTHSPPSERKARASRMTMPGRRMMLSVAPLIPFIALGEAKAETTDLAVMCDLTLGPAVCALGRAFRAETEVRIHVFPVVVQFELGPSRLPLKHAFYYADSTASQMAGARLSLRRSLPRLN
jgi:hypothetical protein